ncbi:MAG: hypothetical protein Fur0027_07250 [Raineya sp.]
MIRTLQKLLNEFGYQLAIDGLKGKATLQAQKDFERRLASVFTNHTGKPNYTGLFAVRCVENEFDNIASDYLAWVQNGELQGVVACSTRAGKFWVQNPITYGGITGTAILAEGFYKDTWLGSWQTRFGFRSFELLQQKPVKIYRDGNRNKTLDRHTTQTGLFGINIHTAGWNNLIDRWSAGCIVVPKAEWDRFVALYLQAGLWYSLLLAKKSDLQNGV